MKNEPKGKVAGKEDGAALLFGAYLDGRFGGKLPRRSPGLIRRAENDGGRDREEAEG